MSSHNEHMNFKTPYLDKLKGVNSFKAPKGYFKELENVVSARNSIQGSDDNKGLGVPKGYFDQLAVNVKNRIAQEEKGLEELAGVNSFSVPKDYFETLEEKVLSKINRNGKVIQLFSIRSFAYAASIAALIAVSIFVFDGNEGEQKDPLLASNIQFEELSPESFFEEIIESELPMDGIVFESINLEEVEIEEEFVDIIEEDEIVIDAIDFIELDSDELDLFDY